MQPDPKSLSFAYDHMTIVIWLAIGSLCCFAPWILMSCVRKLLIPATPMLWLALLAVPWLLVLVALFVDPGSFVNWFLD
jgi:hypothetical protein